jgi:hypothetical protein
MTTAQIPIEPGTAPIEGEGTPAKSLVCANCDIRAWVRAPDLRPSSSLPAEIRISATGAGAKDIAGLSVGLRLKERAIVKMK